MMQTKRFINSLLGIVMGLVALIVSVQADPLGDLDGHTGRVSITLESGARIDADMIHLLRDRVILDLGFDVLMVPRASVLSVVSEITDDTIETTSDRGIYSVGHLEAAPLQDLVRRYGDSIVMVQTPSGLGTGFFISAEGHLVTNYHVVEGETTASITLFLPTRSGYERRELQKVRILALNPLRDLALLQISLSELGEDHAINPLVISSDRGVQVGDVIFAVGNPLGLERSVTEGIVSSTTRTIGHLRFIQTDASINPGNSGGPIMNRRGEVVGVVCAGATYFDGLAFGIPASDLIDFLDNWDAYLYNPAQPQNRVTYLPPPFRTRPEHAGSDDDHGGDDASPDPAAQ